MPDPRRQPASPTAHPGPLAVALGGLLAASVAGTPAMGQDAVPTGRPPAAAPQATPRAPARDATALDRTRPLLREGLTIVEARGTVRRDDEHGTWIYAIDSADESAEGYELWLLPCARMEEMVQAVQAAPDREVVFEVTGQIYVFRNRNYLLPVHAPQFTQRAPAETVEPGPAPPVEMEEGLEVTAGDTARTIMRDLERSVGSLARVRGGAADEASASGRPLMHEGTLLMSRRGQIRRNRQGGWIFVFDADAEGRADPPVALLPCLMLETIERHGRTGQNRPVLISGTVYTYRGLNYLLPTVMQIARERTTLVP